MNYGYIYKTTNLVNNKIYIGQKKGQFNRNYFGSSKSLKRDVLESKHRFKLEVVVYAEDKDKLNELEIQYIKEYREKFGRHNLYNITEGGIGFDGESIEVRQKIRNSLLGRKLTKEHCEHISIGLSGRKCLKETRDKIKNSLLGRTRPDEVRKKISESMKKIRIDRSGEKAPWYGKKRSLQDKQKISDGMKRYRAENN